MVFRWLKGRSTKAQTETQEVVKSPVGLGTIELNPFGVDSIVESTDDSTTVLMPELEVSNETEVRATLDGYEDSGDSAFDIPLSDDEGAANSTPDAMLPNQIDSTELSPSHRVYIIPSLRREAMRLRYALAHVDPERDQDATPELWKSYLRLVPTDRNGWLSLGEFHLLRGELNQAEVVFRTALEFQPKDALTSGALGHTLMEQGRFKDARSFLDVACQGMPEEMDLQQSMLTCLKSCGDVEAVKLQGLVIEELRRGTR